MIFDMTKLKETVKYMECDDGLFFVLSFREEKRNPE